MTSYIDLVRAGADERGDDVLYTFLTDGESEELTLTWAQLDLRARAIAGELQARVLAGERVLLVYPAGIDYVVAFFACLYAGAIAVPAYPPELNRSVSQLHTIIPDAGIEVALTDPDVYARIDAFVGVEPALATLSWIVTSQVPDGRAADWHQPAVTRDSPAFLQYTSGSTSAPKGVVVTHGNLLHCGSVFARLVEPGARVLSWLPQYHDLGLFFGLLQPVYGRNPIIMMTPLDFLRRPARWVQAISRYRVRATAGPNFAYDLCARRTGRREVQDLDLSCWQVAINAAEPVRAATLDRFDKTFAVAGFRSSTHLNLYGLAEGLVLTTGSVSDAPRVERFDSAALGQGRGVPASEQGLGTTLVSAGRAVDGQLVVLVDPDTGAECGPGRVGEIWVAGDSVGIGYWGRLLETAEAFDACTADGNGPFLRTGDLGFTYDGELFVTGRRKDVIVIRGQNTYPQDIERSAEESHPALRPGCVAAVDISSEEENEGDRIVIVQEVRPDAGDDLEGAAAAVRRAISTEHAVGVHAVVLITAGQIPKTSSGKIRRSETLKMLQSGAFEVQHQWWPAEPPTADLSAEVIESWLKRRVAERFGLPLEEIDVRAPFAEFGMNSADAVEVATDLAAWLRFPVPTLIMWDHPTIEGIAGHLAAAIARRAGESARDCA
ncbi:AMP-binding protein [Nocardia sp. BMG51109]|uniref:AMP-binding protein n=1 Tax=Nocardia sp. BMG51109 TaxID=1056816 RepID=UPI000463F935|nr:AMP-binding protein [Nocardia sp. BMG51109]